MILKEYMVPMRDGTKLYTRVILPEEEGAWPVSFSRSPYDARDFVLDENDPEISSFIAAGYALVHQSCRGTARSEGFFAPFETEREDGLDALQWIREQPFYNGEIYVHGGSYGSYVHMAYLPDHPEGVKGAMLWIMPPRMDEGMHVHDMLKQDILLPWYIQQYHKNQTDTAAIMADFPALALKRPLYKAISRYHEGGCPEYEALTRDGLGGAAWMKQPGAGDAREAFRALDIPILIIEGWYDIYIGNGRSMWEDLSPETKAKSAMLMGPWPHKCGLIDPDWDLDLPDGELAPGAKLNWFNHIRTGAPLAFAEEGRVKYYTIGAGTWHSVPALPEVEIQQALYLNQAGEMAFAPGDMAEMTYAYDPENPTRFECGSNAFCTVKRGVRVDEVCRYGEDVLTFTTAPLEEDITITGEIGVALHVRSDCEDTAFFLRLEALVGGKWLPVQETISTLRRCCPDYVPGTEAVVTMQTAPTAWRFAKGSQLRAHVASASFPTYPAHGNTAVPVQEQVETKIAHNTVLLGKSQVLLPIVKSE